MNNVKIEAIQIALQVRSNNLENIFFKKLKKNYITDHSRLPNKECQEKDQRKNQIHQSIVVMNQKKPKDKANYKTTLKHNTGLNHHI